MKILRTLICTLGLIALVAPLSAQSLWMEAKGKARSPYADLSARDVGDILTIVIEERNRVENDEQTRLEKDTDLNAALTNFEVLPRFFQPLPSIAANQVSDFDGLAQYDKDNRFETKISVIVIDVLPNGNLIVEGRRRLVVDRETKIVRISGQVRPVDVLANNTVKSEYVADAAIAYEGEGILSSATTRGWFSRFLDIVWPF